MVIVVITDDRGQINVRDLAPGVTGIEIDRPQKRGALTTCLMREFAKHLQHAETDPSTRALLLSSTGSVFCAGADVSELSNDPPEDDPGSLVLEVLAHMTTPVVAAVQGDAVGMGATMLLHCDAVYATGCASLRMPFVQLGFTPEGGATVLLPMAVGPARARQILLLGEPLSAAEAVSTGLWTEIVAADSLSVRALDSAVTLSELPVDAVASTKQLLRPAGFTDSFRHEALAFSHQRLKKLHAK